MIKAQALGLLSLLLLCGCTGFGFNPQESLEPEVRQFNGGIRWGRYDEVANRLAPEVRAHYMDRINALGDEIEILDYEVTRVDLAPEGKKATARVEISWTSQRRGIVEHTSVAQNWERHKGTLAWQVVKQVRVRGAPMFLFDEPAAKKPAPPPPPSEQPQGQPDKGGDGRGPG